MIFFPVGNPDSTAKKSASTVFSHANSSNVNVFPMFCIPSSGANHYPRAPALLGMQNIFSNVLHTQQGGGPRAVVCTAAFHARVRGSVPGLGSLKETEMFRILCLEDSVISIISPSSGGSPGPV